MTAAHGSHADPDRGTAGPRHAARSDADPLTGDDAPSTGPARETASALDPSSGDILRDMATDALPGPPAAGEPVPADRATPEAWSDARPQGPTDRTALAALVTGLLGLAPVAVVLGVLGIRRTTRRARRGRAAAVAGLVLGATVMTVALLGWAAAVTGGISTTGWRSAGTSGDSAAALAATGSQGPMARGDDPLLDDLWSRCAAGQDISCDELYSRAAAGSEYEAFADDCGGRGRRGVYCSGLARSTPDATTSQALEALYTRCAAGDDQACDELFLTSPPASRYERFADTCGGRGRTGTSCAG